MTYITSYWNCSTSRRKQCVITALDKYKNTTKKCKLVVTVLEYESAYHERRGCWGLN